MPLFASKDSVKMQNTTANVDNFVRICYTVSRDEYKEEELVCVICDSRQRLRLCFCAIR